MARKTGARSIYDTHNNVALADGEQHNPGDLKEKLSKVREVVPSMSKDQICMVLRSYDYDVNATITAISENGPEEALREWNCAGNKVKPSNKNRKRKKKNKRDQTTGPAVEGIDTGGGDEAKKDLHPEKQGEENDKTEEPLTSTSQQESDPESYKQNGRDIVKPPEVSYGWGDDEPPEIFRKSEVKFEEVVHPVEPKSRSKPSHSHGGGRSKSSSDTKFSDSNSPGFSTTSTLPKKTCLEKSLKDLSRQTVALQRVQVLLEEELRKAERAIKTAFSEVQKMLCDRQAQLEQEMEKVKSDARAMLQRRQKLAAELKARSETASTLADCDLTELRDDIKHFVVERKYDEELGKTVRFACTKERIEKEIKDLGQVVHVRDPYTCRRLSLSSGASSNYPDSSYQPSATSSPVCRSQYYTYEQMKEDDGGGGRKSEGTSGYGRTSDGRSVDTRSSKVYTNSHRSNYRGSSPGTRSGGYLRGGRARRSDDLRYNRGERGGLGNRTGYGGSRPQRYISGTNRGRYSGDVGRRSRDDESNRKPSPDRVNGRA